MNKILILTAVVTSGCATVDSRPGGDTHRGALGAAPLAASCRMGAVPVCKKSRDSEGLAPVSCRCAYVPANLTNRDSFGFRGFRRRH